MLHRLTSADSPNLRLCSDNRHIAAATTKHRLLKDYGNVTVLLSSANTFSYEKQSQLLRCSQVVLGTLVSAYPSADHKDLATCSSNGHSARRP